MKMTDIHGNLVNVDVRESSYPIRGLSKSRLQQELGLYLRENFPVEGILEEFTVPGSRMKLDFFIPDRKLAFEVNGAQHDEYTPVFHGQPGEMKFAKQKGRDIKKRQWCIDNGFELVEVYSEEDFDKCKGF